MCYIRITISLQIILKLKLQTTRYKLEKLFLLRVRLASRMNYFSTWRISIREFIILIDGNRNCPFRYLEWRVDNPVPMWATRRWMTSARSQPTTPTSSRSTSARSRQSRRVWCLVSARPPDTLPARAPLPRHKSRGPCRLMLVRKVKCTNPVSSLQCVIYSRRFRLIVS